MKQPSIMFNGNDYMQQECINDETSSFEASISFEAKYGVPSEGLVIYYDSNDYIKQKKVVRKRGFKKEEVVVNRKRFIDF